jgi:4-amino-4-deoxy-L-arabinose transferase-like glycosyltransferase
MSAHQQTAGQIEPAQSRPQLTKAKLVALLAIVLLAAFLRLYRIDTIPPGDRYDPAYYGVDALRILGGEWPVFFSTNFGREALFSYLVALYIALFGIAPQAMYVTSAVVGILTVPATYLLAAELFSTEEGRLGQFGGLVAAAAVAISYWHLNWSRFGVRAILLPFLAALTFYFLWRALRTDSKRNFAAAGFFLGLSLYSYQAARLLPVLVVLAFVYVAASRRRLTRNDLVHLSIVGLVALIAFAPLGTYFLTHPGSFYERVGQTSILSSSEGATGHLRAIGKGLKDTLLAISFYGDLEPTTNLPGRPILNGLLSLLFFAGVLISLFRIRKPAYLFILSWLALMAVPAVLSQQGPIAKRAIGTLPAVMMAMAIGALVPWDVLSAWVERRGWRQAKGISLAALVAILAIFLYSTALTYRDYFIVWAGDPDLFTHFEVGPTAIGQYADTLPPEERVYISPLQADHPSVIYNSRARLGMKSFDGRACLVVPEPNKVGTTFIIVPGEDPNSLELLRSYFPEGKVVAEGPLHYQQPYFLAFHVPPDVRASVAPSHPMEVDWVEKIKLLGYDLERDTFQPGDSINLALYFQVLEELDDDYTFFAHLLGPEHPESGSPLWGQHDSEPCQRAYPTSIWTPGEIVRDQLAIAIPEDAPPGDYQLKVGFYLLEDMTRLPATDAGGQRFPDDAALLKPLRIEAR